jgi:hypothetical protein
MNSKNAQWVSLENPVGRIFDLGNFQGKNKAQQLIFEVLN